MLPHPLPEELVELIARRFRVLGEPLRIRLLDQLLAEAGIVGRRKHGNHVYYRIIDEGVLRLCEDVCGSVQAQLAELSRLLQASEN
jgi:hypothetical protein